jgi:hypothetical protein
MFGQAPFASLELLLQAADIISQREEAGEPVIDSHVVPSSYKISYMDSGASSAGSESSDGNDSDHFTVPSRSTQNKPYKRPTNTKRKQQQALQLLQNKSDAQLRGAANHNEVEKRRRAYLSHCYTALKEAVPGLENSKASNVTVLRGAVDEIKKLEDLSNSLEAARAQQYALRKQLLRNLPADFKLPFAATPAYTDEQYDSDENGAAVPDSYGSMSDTDSQDATTLTAHYDAAPPPHLPIKAVSRYVGQGYTQQRTGGPARTRRKTRTA